MIIYGSCSGSSGSRYNVWLDVVQNSQNIGNNTSNITVTLKLKRNDGYSASAWNSYVNQNTVKLTVNGSVVVNTNMTFDTRDGKTATLGKWTGNVSHDSDGKYSKTIKGEFTTGNTGVSSGLSQGTFTATTIPRASTLVFDKSSVNPAADIKATITRASSTFLHTLVYSIGSKKIEAKSIGTAHTFTVPQNFAEEIKSAVKGTVNVTLITYNGSLEVGRKSYSFSLIIPNNATYRPDFTIALTRQDNGVPSDWGVYVQGKSGVTVNISGVSYKYGASYKSVSVSVGDVQKAALPSVFSLPKDGTVQVSVKVTDTRGLSTTKTTNITVHKYAPPTAVITFLERRTEDGALGIYFIVIAKISSVNDKNTRDYSIQYRKMGAEWKNAETIINVDTQSITALGYCKTDITETDTYELKLTCEDAFTSTVTYGKIGTELCAFNIKKGGTGAAFGKYAEMDNVFEIDYDLKVNGRCDKRLLWSGTLTAGNTITLSDDLSKYRQVFFRMSGSVTIFTATIQEDLTQVRAAGMFAKEGVLELSGITGTYSDNKFTFERYTGFNISASEITAITSFTTITEIWGIK